MVAFADRLSTRPAILCLIIALMTTVAAGCTYTESPHTSESHDSPATSKEYVLIYDGPVAADDAPEAVAAIAEEAGWDVEYVSDIAELPDLLPEAAIFIVGGTEDDIGPLYSAFTPEVTAALKNYLKDGGRYLGICGGGFLASTGWEDGDDFVPMLGLTPAESGDLIPDPDPKILPVRWLGESYPMYFQGGPIYYPEESREAVRVIAKYENGQIAALLSSHGKGKVAVLGPHPEARESWADELEDGDEWVSTNFLVEDLLEEVLSDRPVKP